MQGCSAFHRGVRQTPWVEKPQCAGEDSEDHVHAAEGFSVDVHNAFLGALDADGVGAKVADQVGELRVLTILIFADDAGNLQQVDGLDDEHIQQTVVGQCVGTGWKLPP